MKRRGQCEGNGGIKGLHSTTTTAIRAYKAGKIDAIYCWKCGAILKDRDVERED